VPDTLPDFNQKWGYSADFHKVPNIKFRGNSLIGEPRLYMYRHEQADGQRDRRKKGYDKS